MKLDRKQGEKDDLITKPALRFLNKEPVFSYEMIDFVFPWKAGKRRWLDDSPPATSGEMELNKKWKQVRSHLSVGLHSYDILWKRFEKG